MPKTTYAIGNEAFDALVFQAAVTFPTLAANASNTNTLTLPGGVGVQNVLPGDFISACMQAPPAHLFLDNVYCATPGVLTITWSTDGTGVTGASNLQVIFNIVRGDAGPGTANLPQAFT